MLSSRFIRLPLRASLSLTVVFGAACSPPEERAQPSYQENASAEREDVVQLLTELHQQALDERSYFMYQQSLATAQPTIDAYLRDHASSDEQGELIRLLWDSMKTIEAQWGRQEEARTSLSPHNYDFYTNLKNGSITSAGRMLDMLSILYE